MMKTYRPISPRNLRMDIMNRLKRREHATDQIVEHLIEAMWLYDVSDLRHLLYEMNQDTRVDAIARVAIKKKLATFGVGVA